MNSGTIVLTVILAATTLLSVYAAVEMNAAFGWAQSESVLLLVFIGGGSACLAVKVIRNGWPVGSARRRGFEVVREESED
jgi:hypothetical protein